MMQRSKLQTEASGAEKNWDPEKRAQGQEHDIKVVGNLCSMEGEGLKQFKYLTSIKC